MWGCGNGCWSDNNMKPFEGLLGNNCELRMLEYLLPLDGMDFNITKLAEEVGVSHLHAIYHDFSLNR